MLGYATLPAELASLAVETQQIDKNDPEQLQARS
jgi:hypothetical protein